MYISYGYNVTRTHTQTNLIYIICIYIVEGEGQEPDFAARLPEPRARPTYDDEDDDSLGGSGSDSAPEGPKKNELNPKSLARSSSRDSRSSSDEDVVVKTEGEIKV